MIARKYQVAAVARRCVMRFAPKYRPRIIPAEKNAAKRKMAE
jgi:hypothetical protein